MPQQCMCGGTMHETRATYEGEFAFIHNVPTWVCERCDEIEYEISVVGRMLKMARYAKAHEMKDIDYDSADIDGKVDVRIEPDSEEV